MKLHALIQDAGIAPSPNAGNPEIKGVVCDSRKVKPGFLFVAIAGNREDGRSYIRDALARGAVAVVAGREGANGTAVLPPASRARGNGSGSAGDKPDGKRDFERIEVDDARQALAHLSASYHGHPSRALRLAGVTGTNGKTSVAYLIRDMLRAAGLAPGMIGTIEYCIGERSIPAARTTPDGPTLHAMLAEMASVGCRSAVMEVSSHALAQHRTDAVEFDVAAFTNLSRDHLDYHRTMDSYFEAKRRLFESLGTGGKRATAVVNLDDPRGKRLLAEGGWKGDTLSCGVDAQADVRAENVVLTLSGATFRARTPWGDLAIETPLMGAFNVSNALIALACGHALGAEPEVMAETLRHPTLIPGRMERMAAKNGAMVFVDYAHTDDALECALRTLRELTDGRVIAVFGCGGERDRSKRPAMGRVAGRWADHTVLTSDNPRGEEPMAIIEAIRAGFDAGASLEIVEDRREAIEQALRMAKAGDAVLIAGKGHETFQQFANRTAPFDDRQIVRAFAL